MIFPSGAWTHLFNEEEDIFPFCCFPFLLEGSWTYLFVQANDVVLCVGKIHMFIPFIDSLISRKSSCWNHLMVFFIIILLHYCDFWQFSMVLNWDIMISNLIRWSRYLMQTRNNFLGLWFTKTFEWLSFVSCFFPFHFHECIIATGLWWFLFITLLFTWEKPKKLYPHGRVTIETSGHYS